MEKITKKIKIKRDKKPVKIEKITNKNISEHREDVLNSAKKFKYPLQYSTHKVLIHTIIIAIISLTGAVLLSWFMIYKQQSENEIIYRLSQLVPVPIARVDGEDVRYSDYLLRIRNAKGFLYKYDREFINSTAESQNEIIASKKRSELDLLEKYAFANKLARENNIIVTDQEVNDFIDQQRGNITLKLYESSVLMEYFNWTIDDYKIFVRDELIRQKVALAIDQDAASKSNRIYNEVIINTDENKNKFDEIAANADLSELAMNGGKIIDQDIKSDDDINGLLNTAKSLEIGAISQIISGNDGYYIIRVDAKTDATISYTIIKISLNEFNNRFDKIKSDGKIKEYITI